MFELAVLSESNPVLLLIVAVFLGLCLGSFLNVVIHRLPGMLEHEWKQQSDGDQLTPAPNLASPPSSCPSCGSRIRAYQNIPVVSYLLLGGKCANCSKKISLRYPLVEILGAILAVFIVFRVDSTAIVFASLLFSYSMLALFFIDLDRYLLPDIITLPLLWAGLFANYFGLFTDLHSAVLGAIAGYLSLWCVFHLFKLLTGKEGLGYGDFKLVAAAGAWLGWQMLPFIVLFGSMAGAIIGGGYLAISRHGKDHPIPFGPFLAFASWVAMFWGEEIVQRYLRYIGI